MKNEIFSSGTTALLAKVLPRDYMEHIYDQIDSVQATEEETMDRICGKVSALLTDQNAPDKKKPPPRSATVSVVQRRNNHNCSKSKGCKGEFGLLGCAELYKLETVKERRDHLKEVGHCMRYGEIFMTGKSGGATHGG